MVPHWEDSGNISYTFMSISMRFFSSTSQIIPKSNPRTIIPPWLLSTSTSSSSRKQQILLSLSIVSGLLHLPSLRSLRLSLSLFILLRRHCHVNLLPDSFTLTSLLLKSSSLPLTQSLHSLSLKLRLHADTFVLNSLIHSYSSLNSLHSASSVFRSAPPSAVDAVSWNTLISAHLKSRLPRRALSLFAAMLSDGSLPMDPFTPVPALAACAQIASLRLGRAVHSLLVLYAFPLDVYLGSSLVTMYSKCGALHDARKAFDAIPLKNAVCWTSIISGYSQSGRPREAVALFREMQLAGVNPDAATLASVVSSCAQLGALDQGKYVHAYCDAHGIGGGDIRVKNALIDMYSKCGDVGRALRVFRGLVRPDVFSWTSMICGLAANGKSCEALQLFSRMEESSGVLPNEVTFLGVLSACSHGGLVDEGWYYFRRMGGVYGLVPRLEHYGCMVDLLGRAKRLSEAEKFIREMPIEPDVVTWRSLLFACVAVGEVGLAEVAATRMVELEPGTFGGNVLLSNIYAVASRWSDVYEVRGGRRTSRKKPSCSSVEVNGCVHEFLVSDTTHCRIEDIRETLSGINRLLVSESYT